VASPLDGYTALERVGDDDGEGLPCRKNLKPVHSACSASKNGKRHIINDSVMGCWMHASIDRSSGHATVEAIRFKHSFLFHQGLCFL
jgi:hypothetical protein